MLRSLGISYGQGYYLGSPQPLTRTTARETSRMFLEMDRAPTSIADSPDVTDPLIQIAYGQDLHHQI